MQFATVRRSGRRRCGPIPARWHPHALHWTQRLPSLRVSRMEIGFDPARRAKVLAERGLDLLDAPSVFDSRGITVEDSRYAYGEVRLTIYGWMDDVAIAVVWTEREGRRRVISMRRKHRWEIEHVGLD